MKIAIIIYSINIGGVETVMKSLAVGLKRTGHQITFIETEGKGKWSDYFKVCGFNVKTFSIKWFQSKVNYSKFLAKQLRSHDVLLINDSPYAQAALGCLPNNVLAFPILHNKLDSMLKNAIGNYNQWDKVIAISPSIFDFLKPNILESRIAYIPNGVKVEKTFTKMVYPNLRVLFLGRLNHAHKGVLYIPEILKTTLLKSNNIKLTLIGERTPDTLKLIELIDEYELTNYIEIKDPLRPEEVEKILPEFDVLLFPSHFEGHPISLLEAMANGLVPVASNCSGQISHVIDDSIDGFLCEIGDIDAFADKLIKLSEDRVLLGQLSKNAHRKVLENYSIDLMIDKYLNLFNSLNNFEKIRSNKIENNLLFDLPSLPFFLIKPIRKIKKLINTLTC